MFLMILMTHHAIRMSHHASEVVDTNLGGACCQRQLSREDHILLV